jgi:hypothetical protein
VAEPSPLERTGCRGREAQGVGNHGVRNYGGEGCGVRGVVGGVASARVISVRMQRYGWQMLAPLNGCKSAARPDVSEGRIGVVGDHRAGESESSPAPSKRGSALVPAACTRR